MLYVTSAAKSTCDHDVNAVQHCQLRANSRISSDVTYNEMIPVAMLTGNLPVIWLYETSLHVQRTSQDTNLLL